MISVKTLVRLAGNPAHLCPHQWLRVGVKNACRADPSLGVHVCVGDIHHRGKHICRCGNARRVAS